MVNVLIADDNLYFATSLMNYINHKNKNIKVCAITSDGKSTLSTLYDRDDIDVILMDLKMPIYSGGEILEKIKSKERYISSCIVISAEIDYINNLKKSDIIYTTLFKTKDIEDIYLKINELIDYKENTKKEENLKSKIRKELLYLGYDISHKGTQYLIETIQYIFLNPDRYRISLEKDIYPNVFVK